MKLHYVRCSSGVLYAQLLRLYGQLYNSQTKSQEWR